MQGILYYASKGLVILPLCLEMQGILPLCLGMQGNLATVLRRVGHFATVPRNAGIFTQLLGMQGTLTLTRNSKHFATVSK